MLLSVMRSTSKLPQPLMVHLNYAEELMLVYVFLEISVPPSPALLLWLPLKPRVSRHPLILSTFSHAAPTTAVDASCIPATTIVTANIPTPPPIPLPLTLCVQPLPIPLLLPLKPRVSRHCHRRQPCHPRSLLWPHTLYFKLDRMQHRSLRPECRL